MPDETQSQTPPRGPDGKFQPAEASSEPEAPETTTQEAPVEEPKPKAKDLAGFARRRAKLEERAREVAARERQAQQALAIAQQRDAEYQRQLNAMQQKLEAWEKGNPLAVAQAAGRNLDEDIREFVAGSTPESLAKRAMQETEALRKQLHEERQAEQRRQEEARQRAVEQQRGQTITAIAQHISKNEKQFPYLNHEFTDDQLVMALDQFDRIAQSEGKTYTAAEAVSELERLAKLRYTSLEARRASLFGSKPPAPAPVNAGSSPGRSAASPQPARRVAAPAEPHRGKPRSRQELQRLREQEAEADLAILRAARQRDARGH